MMASLTISGPLASRSVARGSQASSSSFIGTRVSAPRAAARPAISSAKMVTRSAATDLQREAPALARQGQTGRPSSFIDRINDFLFAEEYDDEEWYEGEEYGEHQHEEYMEEDDATALVQEYEVLKLEPQGFEDVWDVAMQALRERRCVILSTRNMDVINAQRAVDFLAGSTQILYGHVEALGDGIFMFAPSTSEVHVVGDAPAHQEDGRPSLFDFMARRR